MAISGFGRPGVAPAFGEQGEVGVCFGQVRRGAQQVAQEHFRRRRFSPGELLAGLLEERLQVGHRLLVSSAGPASATRWRKA